MLDFMRFVDITEHLPNNSIVCRESATYFQDLSTYPPLPLHIYRQGSPCYACSYLCMYDNEYGFTDTEIVQGCRVTNKERTIMELIKYDCDREIINQALVSYMFEWGLSEDTLFHYADKYNVDVSILREYIQDAKDDFNEDWC